MQIFFNVKREGFITTISNGKNYSITWQSATLQHINNSQRDNIKTKTTRKENYQHSVWS